MHIITEHKNAKFQLLHHCTRTLAWNYAHTHTQTQNNQERLSGLRCTALSEKEKQSKVIWARRPPQGGTFHFETVACGSGWLQTQHLSGGCPDFLTLLFLFPTPHSWNSKPAPSYILCETGDSIQHVTHVKRLLLRAMFPGPRVALLSLVFIFGDTKCI